MRLDQEMVRRGLSNTRSKAQEAIKNGFVFCDGKQVYKSSLMVNDCNEITVKEGAFKYVSRAGLKLEKASREFNIDFTNKIMCDIGSSTGGFTDYAIQNDIKKVYAIDVGNNQMDETLRNNSKIVLLENTDFRDIDIDLINDSNIITIDVSFISIKKIIPTIKKLNNVKEIVCLIKPQFECGKELADKYKGIILNKDIHMSVIADIIGEFEKIDYNPKNLTYSPIRGGSGNIEYLLYLMKGNTTQKSINIESVVTKAFKNLN